MKRISFLLLLIFSVLNIYSQQEPFTQAQIKQITDAVIKELQKQPAPPDAPQVSDAIINSLFVTNTTPARTINPDISELAIAIKKALKDDADAKDTAVETSNFNKAEWDTVSILKQNRFYQFKAETEDTYYVVKYFDYDLPLHTFTQKVQEYKDITIIDGESIADFKIRKKALLDEKNSANPFKICYLYLDPQRPITTLKTDKYSLNLMTVPFKIFPSTKNFPSNVNGEIDNVGLFGTIRFGNWSKLKADGEEFKASWGAGLYLAPSIVKLDSTNSSFTDEVTKMYLTTALGISIKYGNVTVALIPVGFDNALSDSGKAWDYAGTYWWGFGLGIDTDFFNF